MIRELSKLATSKHREYALRIIDAGIEAVLPKNIMRRNIRLEGTTLRIHEFYFDLNAGRLFVIGGGKAAGKMAEALEEIITPEAVTAGIVNCNSEAVTKKIKVNIASHPFPDSRGVFGVTEMLTLKEKYKINQNDLVLCLISGGGSALMPMPEGNITIEELAITNKLIIESGAEIHDMNIIRKHISKIKGGRLAEHFAPAFVVSLILSDVIGDNQDTIASGPTTPDTSTFLEAYDIIDKYELREKLPLSVIGHIGEGMLGRVKETPIVLNNVYNLIIGNNALALNAMALEAKRLGLRVETTKGPLSGEAKLKAAEIGKTIPKLLPPCALITGGETVVTVSENPGLGGRNQEFVVATIPYLNGLAVKCAVASVGTDGSDFLKNVAGGIVDTEIASVLKKNEINPEEFLTNNNPFPLLKRINGVIQTGPTGTNVCDIAVYVII